MLDNSKQSKFQRAATAAYGARHAIKGDVEGLTAAFRAARDDDRAAVRRGDLGANPAKARAAAAFADFQKAVSKVAAEHAGRADKFRQAVVDADESRTFRAANAKGDDLTKQSIALQKQILIELQIQARRDDLRAGATPHGSDGPTVRSWLDVLKASSLGGDEAAVELARREIGRLLPASGLMGEDRGRAESAIVRPGHVDPAKVAKVIAFARDLGPDEMGRQAGRARSLEDASAVVAFALLARDEYARANGGPVPAWAHEVFVFLGQAPGAVIDHLQTLVADEVRTSSEAAALIVGAAEAEADYVAALNDLDVPTSEELVKRAHFESMPKAKPGEAVGLAGHLPRDSNPPPLPAPGPPVVVNFP